MSTTLYLTETRAAHDYACASCGAAIAKGALHFRHDPHPQARMKRGAQTSHWCRDCITRTPGVRDAVGRLWIRPAKLVTAHARAHRDQLELELARVEIVGIGRLVAERLAHDPLEVHRLNADQFEEFVCDRLYAMGMEPKRTGAVNKKDGGVDILFWPRLKGTFPFLGAAQVKHHRVS